MRILLIGLLFSFSLSTFSQSAKPKIYNPAANASKDLNEAIAKAKSENKHVLVQVGGNWCPWCIKLHKYVESHYSVDSLIKADYIFVRINYSSENKNHDVMERLEYPQRFGFPVIVVLDDNGRRVHTQETGSLEENKSYSEKKLKRFLLSWNKAALDPKTYE